MTDDNIGDTTPRPEGAPEPQPGAVMTPPPPPPAPPATGEQPPRWGGDERPRRHGGLVGGLVLIAVGIILLVSQYFPDLGFDKLWPVILIVIGIAIIFRRR